MSIPINKGQGGNDSVRWRKVKVQSGDNRTRWKRPTPCNFRVERDTVLVRHLGSNLDVAKETEAKITDKLTKLLRGVLRMQ